MSGEHCKFINTVEYQESRARPPEYRSVRALLAFNRQFHATAGYVELVDEWAVAQAGAMQAEAIHIQSRIRGACTDPASAWAVHGRLRTDL